MPRSMISYDKDLPAIEGRCAWEQPRSYLVKDGNTPTGWSEDKSGRRPSQLLLIPKIRKAVDAWRAAGYEGASEVAKRLFEYWFEEDHEVARFAAPFRYYFCQREAIETLVWLVEIAGQKDAKKLIETYGTINQRDLISKNVEFQTVKNGSRQLRRYIPELDREGIQDLPPEDLRRFAFKMATGSGKTWVMAMAVVWSHFHKLRVPGSELSTNFLIVAPNIIVYQRLVQEFESNRIFHKLPLIPPEWLGDFSQKVILRGQDIEPDSSENLFLTNIHQLYLSRDEEWEPANPIEAMLGRAPNTDLAAANRRSMLERVKTLKDIVVLNDEAHHVHNDELQWNQSLLDINKTLPTGISAWLDFSATPKDQNGMYFPWTVVDYPLAQAVEDRIVKMPLLVTNEDDPGRPAAEPENINRENIIEKYGYWLQAAVQRWQEHQKTYKPFDTKPVLFIMASKNVYADVLGQFLVETKDFGFDQSEVLVIHTDNTGEVRKGDLEKAREAARNIDLPESKIKAIVSVMMLREGWDVRNVTVVLGLRPFTSDAEILPEQVIGRGLRLMKDISPDDTQTLEVLGTKRLLDVLRKNLETEGVGTAGTGTPPPPASIIEPLEERAQYDIAIPITKPTLEHDIRKLSELKASSLKAIYEQEELDKQYRIRLKLEAAPLDAEVHQTDVMAHEIPPSEELLVRTTNKVIGQAQLTNCFAELYPIVREYVQHRCFGRTIDLDNDAVRSHLHSVRLQEGIAKYMARMISQLTARRRKIRFDNEEHLLSKTKPFRWSRNLPLYEAKKTVFNLVATYNQLEKRFAKFLDKATDIVRFAALGTTEQGKSGTKFRVDYLKPSGAIGFYHPDWVAVQKTAKGEVNWIIETKGRVWEGTEEKDAAMKIWCARVREALNQDWRYVRVDQHIFDARVSGSKTLEDLLQRPGKERLL